MRKILFLIIGLFLVVGCNNQNKRIPDEKLVSIVKEIFVTNAYVKKVQPNLFSDTLDYFKPIFAKYGYTIDDLRYTLYKMSMRKSSRISWIVSAALDSLNHEFAGLKYYKNLYDRIEQVIMSESQDTVFERAEMIKLEGQKKLSKADFVLKVDTNRIYSVRFRYKIDSVSSGQRLRTQIATVDMNGKLVSTNYEYYSREGEGYLTFDILVKYAKEDSLRVKILYFPPKANIPYVRIYIDSVQVSSMLGYSDARNLALRRRLDYDFLKMVNNVQLKADCGTPDIVPLSTPN